MAVDQPAPFRTSTRHPVETSASTTWTIALAGGDGVRLSEYVESRFGQRIPKQYCALLGSRTMLEHTLDRTNQITPAERTLTVIGTQHQPIAMPQLVGKSDHVFRQPSTRDTGLALYVALAMIKRWTPNALVTATPTDHYVAPAVAYVDQLRIAQNVAARLPSKVVLLGAHPTEPDPTFGYLALGDRLTEIPEVRQLVRFVEKPDATTASELIGGGALWNTMVCCGTVDAFWEMGRAADPRLLDILDSLVPLIGTPDEDDGIEHVYRAYLPVSFSRDILEEVPERLCALELSGVDWSDWGNPERIEHSLAVRRSRSLLPVTTRMRAL